MARISGRLKFFVLVFFLKLSLCQPLDPDDFLFQALNREIIISDRCTEVLAQFAESASNFTLCSIQNARPIHMCERCISHYVNFRDQYEATLNEHIEKDDNTTCKSILISRDKLEVLLTFHDNIKHIWENAHCDACYDWHNKVPTASEKTLKFYKLFNNTKTCINDNVLPNLNNSEQVCKLCMDSYIELDSYYQTLSKAEYDLESVCMDIIDSMNNTRVVWSKTLNCCSLRRHPEIIFLTLTGVIGSVPILFYIILRYFGTMRDLPRVLKQTRFKQRFMAALHSRRASNASINSNNTSIQ